MRHNATRHIVWLVDEEKLSSVRSKANVLALKFGWPVETLGRVVEGEFSRGEDCKPTLDVVTPRIYAEMLREGAPLHRTSLILVQTTHALLNAEARDHTTMKFIFKRYSNESPITRPKLALFTSGIAFTSEVDSVPHAIPPSELLPLLTSLVPNLGIAELSSNEMATIIRGLVLETRGYLLEKSIPSVDIESLQTSFVTTILALLSLYVGEAEPGSQQDKYHTEARKDGTLPSEHERRAEYLEPLLPFYTRHSEIIYDSGLVNLEFLRKVEKIAKNWEKAPPQLILNAIAIIAHSTLLLTDLGTQASVHYATKYLTKLTGSGGRRTGKNSVMDKFIELVASLQRVIATFSQENGHNDASSTGSVAAEQRDTIAFTGRSSVLFDLLNKSLVDQQSSKQNQWKPKIVVHAATSVSAHQLKKLLSVKYPTTALFILGEASDEEACEEFFQLGHHAQGEADGEPFQGPSVLITVPSSRRAFAAEFEKHTKAHPYCRPRFMPGAIYGPYRAGSHSTPAAPTHERFSPEYTVDSVVILRFGSTTALDMMRMLKESSESETIVTLKRSNFSLASLLSGLPAVLQEFKTLVTAKIDVVADCHRVLDTIKDKVLKRYQAPAVLMAPTTSINGNGVSTTLIKPVGPIAKDEHSYTPGMGSVVPSGADWYAGRASDQPSLASIAASHAERSNDRTSDRTGDCPSTPSAMMPSGGNTYATPTNGTPMDGKTPDASSNTNGSSKHVDSSKTAEQAQTPKDHIMVGNKKVPYDVLATQTPPPHQASNGAMAIGSLPPLADGESRSHIDYASAFNRQGNFMSSFMDDHASPLPALTPTSKSTPTTIPEPALPQSYKSSALAQQQQKSGGASYEQTPGSLQPKSVPYEHPQQHQKTLSAYEKSMGGYGLNEHYVAQLTDSQSQYAAAPVLSWNGSSGVEFQGPRSQSSGPLVMARTQGPTAPSNPSLRSQSTVLYPQGPSSPPSMSLERTFESKVAPPQSTTATAKTTSPPTQRASLHDSDSQQGPHSLNSAMDEVMPMTQSKSSSASTATTTTTTLAPSNIGKPPVASPAERVYDDMSALYGTAALYGTNSNPMTVVSPGSLSPTSTTSSSVTDFDPSSDYMRATEAAAAQSTLPMTASANVLTAQNMIASTGANKSETNSDPISLLHIYYSKLGSVDPTYEETVIGGSDHARIYQAICTLPTGETFEGTGNRKKEAKKVAAAHALEYVANIPAATYLNPPTPQQPPSQATQGGSASNLVDHPHANLVHPAATARRPVHFQGGGPSHQGTMAHQGSMPQAHQSSHQSASSSVGGGSSSASMNHLLSGGTYRPSASGSAGFPSWLGGSISGPDSPSPPATSQPQQQHPTSQHPQAQHPQHTQHAQHAHSGINGGYGGYYTSAPANGGPSSIHMGAHSTTAPSINSNMGSASYHLHSGGGGARTQGGAGGAHAPSGGGYGLGNGINGLGNGSNGANGYYAPAGYMPSHHDVPELPLTHHNPIGLVNEYHQKNNIVLPTYHDAGRASGSDHEPLFRCICVLNDGTNRSFESSGTSKKEAKTNVAISVAKELRLLAR